MGIAAQYGSFVNTTLLNLWAGLSHIHHSISWYSLITAYPDTLSSQHIQVHCHHSISWYTVITAYPGTLPSQHIQVHCHHNISRYTVITTYPGTLSSQHILVHCHHSISRYTIITTYPGTLSSQHIQVHCHYSIPNSVFQEVYGFTRMWGGRRYTVALLCSTNAFHKSSQKSFTSPANCRLISSDAAQFMLTLFIQLHFIIL